MIHDWGISCEIVLRWMSLDLNDYKLTLVQVMAWCHQATGNDLSQCWSRSMSPYGVTRPQCVNVHVGKALIFGSSQPECCNRRNTTRCVFCRQQTNHWKVLINTLIKTIIHLTSISLADLFNDILRVYCKLKDVISYDIDNFPYLYNRWYHINLNWFNPMRLMNGLE